jgi:RimJ/RimL family protein N-acetyltransferase
MLGRPYWGLGIATEAAHACLRHAFSEWGREHVISLIHPENQRAIRVAERLGERPQGTTEVEGVKSLVYGISREDFARQAS